MRLMPFYWIRVIGGALYLTGAVLCLVNLVMTWAARPRVYETPVHKAPPLTPHYVDPPLSPSRLAGASVAEVAKVSLFCIATRPKPLVDPASSVSAIT